MNTKKYSCPCCGYFTLEDEPGHFDICAVCGWEDDSIQSFNPDVAGGANRMSLNEARANYKRIGAIDKSFLKSVRPPTDEEERGQN
ncbi:hydrolase [Candidatus Dependentiae bacterium]|nr:MAG: hydrolase [Candidatus Dependentiae bacterium]